jgi:hypothetical protein
MPLHDHDHRLHAAAAGNGNPYAFLTTGDLPLLLRLHTGERIAAPRADLDRLVEASLVTVHDGAYRPAFFVADGAETARIDRHARQVGQEFAARLLADWPAIAATYATLAVSQQWPLADLAFLLVGDRILDVGLLDALAREGALMPPAPARPAPTTPDARYYFWLITGEVAQLGQYGQRVTPLPWPEWTFVTFGQYARGTAPNSARDNLEAAARALTATVGDAETLAARLALPILGADDARRWAAIERACTDALLAVYQEHAADLRDLYAGLRASAYTPHGFGEFFCWYDHVAYAHAIDALAVAGAVVIPTERFGAMLWHEATDSAF